jgi:polysaccharide export outer membrane protein
MPAFVRILLTRPARAGALAVWLGACGAGLPPLPGDAPAGPGAPDYVIGPLDTVQVFVWQAPELSVAVPVRPDGRMSTPLIEDMQAAGRTPSALARAIEGALTDYVQDPVVTVMVSGFAGPPDHQIRVVGEAVEPAAIPFRADLTVLDVMIAVGGLTEFAAGNRAVLVRDTGGGPQSYGIRLDDLLKDGDIRANVPMRPGDVIIIPQSWF